MSFRFPTVRGCGCWKALMLRVKDVDFERGQLNVRDPKWKHDRVTMLPAATVAEIHEQLTRARILQQEDLASGFGRVWLPEALDRKFSSAARDWRWQWVFPAPQRWKGKDGSEGRHHYHETNVQRAVTRGARAAGITKRVTCHTFRHWFATHLRGARPRHSDHPGAPRPPRRLHDHDPPPQPAAFAAR